jgi:hypothetical protein
VEREGGRQLLWCARPGAQPGEVVAGGGQRDVPGLADRSECIMVGGQERAGVAPAVGVEVARVRAPLGAVVGALAASSTAAPGPCRARGRPADNAETQPSENMRVMAPRNSGVEMTY